MQRPAVVLFLCVLSCLTDPVNSFRRMPRDRSKVEKGQTGATKMAAVEMHNPPPTEGWSNGNKDDLEYYASFNAETYHFKLSIDDKTPRCPDRFSGSKSVAAIKEMPADTVSSKFPGGFCIYCAEQKSWASLFNGEEGKKNARKATIKTEGEAQRPECGSPGAEEDRVQVEEQMEEGSPAFETEDSLLPGKEEEEEDRVQVEAQMDGLGEDSLPPEEVHELDTTSAALQLEVHAHKQGEEVQEIEEKEEKAEKGEEEYEEKVHKKEANDNGKKEEKKEEEGKAE